MYRHFSIYAVNVGTQNKNLRSKKKLRFLRSTRVEEKIALTSLKNKQIQPYVLSIRNNLTKKYMQTSSTHLTLLHKYVLHSIFLKYHIVNILLHIKSRNIQPLFCLFKGILKIKFKLKLTPWNSVNLFSCFFKTNFPIYIS